MITLYVALAALAGGAVGYLILAVLVGKLLRRRSKRDDWMDLADACRSSDTPLYDQLLTEIPIDDIDPMATLEIIAAVEDELAQRRGRA